MQTYTIHAVIASLILLSACSGPGTTIDPVSSSQTTLPEKGSQASVSQGVVVKIIEYDISPEGGKSVIFNGQNLPVKWRLQYEYGYDSQSRLISQKATVQNNAAWWQLYSYQYNTDLVQRYQDSENKEFLNTLLLNEKGYLQGSYRPDEFVYDADGYLIGYTGNDLRDTYTIKNGNALAKETVYGSGLVQKNTYEYDLAKPGIPSTQTFRGQQNRNLLSKQTLISTATNSTDSQTTVFTYHYDFDTQGRAVREFVISSIDPSRPTSIREFVYQ